MHWVEKELLKAEVKQELVHDLAPAIAAAITRGILEHLRRDHLRALPVAPANPWPLGMRDEDVSYLQDITRRS